MVEVFTGTIGNLTPLYDSFGKPMYNKFLWYRIPLFDYRSVIPDLTYIDSINAMYQMDRHFQTDGGSIPPILRMIPYAHLDPFNFARAYLFHDCGFQYGGLYIKYPHDDRFKFRYLTRIQVNELLEKMLPLDGATEYDVKVITTGVAMGSPFIWDAKKKPAEQREARRKSRINVYDTAGNLVEDNGGL